MVVHESQRHGHEDQGMLSRIGGAIVWIGVPLVVWAALMWAAIQALRSLL